MKRVFVSLVILCGIILAPLPAAAAGPATTMAACSSGVANFLGFESWDSCLKAKYGGVAKIMALNDIWLIVLPLLETAIKASGYVAAGFIIWGGIKYTKGQGEPAEINAARQIITNAIIGLILCIISVSIVQFVARGIS